MKLPFRRYFERKFRIYSMIFYEGYKIIAKNPEMVHTIGISIDYACKKSTKYDYILRKFYGYNDHQLDNIFYNIV